MPPVRFRARPPNVRLDYRNLEQRHSAVLRPRITASRIVLQFLRRLKVWDRPIPRQKVSSRSRKANRRGPPNALLVVLQKPRLPITSESPSLPQFGARKKAEGPKRSALRSALFRWSTQAARRSRVLSRVPRAKTRALLIRSSATSAAGRRNRGSART